MTPECRDCDHCFMEPDMVICCGHPRAFDRSPFGLNVNLMRAPEAQCGPEARLFTPRQPR